MTVISNMVMRFSAEGGDEVQKENEKVQNSINQTAKTAKKQQGTISRWMQRNKTAILGMAAAATGAMYGIIKASPTLSAELDNARMAFSMFAMEVGETFAPLFEAVADILWDLYDAFKDLSPIVQTFLSAFAGGLIIATIAMAAYTWAVGAGITATAVFNAVLAATPAGLIVIAIAALIAVLVVLQKKFNIFGKLLKALEPVIKGVKSVLTSLWQNVLKPLATFLGTTLLKAWDGVVDIFTAIWNIVEGFIAFLNGDGEKAWKKWMSAAGLIENVWQGLVNWFGNLGKKIWNFLVDIIPKIIDWGNKMTLKAINALLGILDWFKELPSNILKSMSVIYPKLVEWGNEITEKAIDGLIGVLDWFKDLPSNILEEIEDVYSKVVKWGNTITSKALNGLSGIIDWFVDLPSNILEEIKDVYPKAVNWGNKMALKAIDGLIDILDWFVDLPDDILEEIKDTYPKVVEWGNTMATKAINGLSGIIDWFGNLWTNIKDDTSDVTSDIKSWGSEMATKAITGLSGIIDWFGGLWSSIKEEVDILWDIYYWGYDAAEQFIGGLINGIKDLASDVLDSLKNAMGFDIRKNDMIAQKWGTDAAKYIKKGFTQGMKAIQPNMVLQGLTQAGGANTTTYTTNTTSLNIEEGAIRIEGGSGQMNEDYLVNRIANELESRFRSR